MPRATATPLPPPPLPDQRTRARLHPEQHKPVGVSLPVEQVRAVVDGDAEQHGGGGQQPAPRPQPRHPLQARRPPRAPRPRTRPRPRTPRLPPPPHALLVRAPLLLPAETLQLKQRSNTGTFKTSYRCKLTLSSRARPRPSRE